MPNTVDKVRVHNALLALVVAGPYYSVDYVPATKLAADIDTATAVAVVPSSAQANEVSVSFDIDSRHGRDLKRDRSNWNWLAVVKFDREVTSHEAEDLWAGSPSILPRSSSFPRQATIHLLGANYAHPVKQGGHNGTQIEFNFEIRQSRR